MSLDMGAVMAKVRQFEKSEEGQRRVKAVLEKYRKEDRSVTAAGSKLMTDKQMRRCACKLAELVKQTARMPDYDLPASVLEDIDSLQPSSVILDTGDGGRVIRMSFKNDLHRESLRKEEGGRTGEGIDNIIALFNNGAPNDGHEVMTVYGWWDGHAPAGKKYIAHGDQGTAWVHNKTSRPDLRFLQRAVAEFNLKYGAEYGVEAVLDSEYTQ